MTNYRKQHQELARVATNNAKYRGHQLGTWSWSRPGPSRVLGLATCLDCGVEASIDTRPEPNGVDMSGTALDGACQKGTRMTRTRDYLEDLRYYVAPVDQGQMVEVAYAMGDDEVVRRDTDQSDGLVTYRVCDDIDPETFNPWNTPPNGDTWTPVEVTP